MNEPCVLWVLEPDGWRIVFRGKRWQCDYQAARWPKMFAAEVVPE